MKEYIRIFNNDNNKEKVGFQAAKHVNKPVRPDTHYYRHSPSERIVFQVIDNPDDPAYRWRSQPEAEKINTSENRFNIRNTENHEPYMPDFSPDDFSEAVDTEEQFMYDVQPITDFDEDEEIHFQEIYNFSDIDSAVEAAISEKKNFGKQVPAAATDVAAFESVKKQPSVKSDGFSRRRVVAEPKAAFSAEEVISDNKVEEKTYSSDDASIQNDSSDTVDDAAVSVEEPDENKSVSEALAAEDCGVSLDDIFDTAENDEDDEEIVFVTIDNTVSDVSAGDLSGDSAFDTENIAEGTGVSIKKDKKKKSSLF